MSTGPIDQADKDRVKVKKPKSADPSVRFTITVTKPETGDMNIRYVWGDLQLLRSNTGGNPVHVSEKTSNGDTPLDPTKENTFDLTFKFEDSDWNDEAGDFINYFLTLTCHDDRQVNLIGYVCSGQLEVYSNGEGVFGPPDDQNNNTMALVTLETPAPTTETTTSNEKDQSASTNRGSKAVDGDIM